MNDYNTDFWSRAEPVAKLAEKRNDIVARLARHLGVDPGEVTVSETREPQGVRLTASWWPA